MKSAVRKRKNIELPVAQFIAIIVLSISLFLIVDFGRRAATGYRVYREEERLEAQLVLLRDARETLLARRDFVDTDAYVEEVARNELKWSLPGETVIVVLPTPQLAPQPISSRNKLVPLSQTDTAFHAWLTLFFPNEVGNRRERQGSF